MFSASIVGTLVLLHAVYSSYEHHHLTGSSAVPNDIWLEILVGLLAINFGTLKSLANTKRLHVLTSAPVSPPHAYLRPIRMSQAMSSKNSLGMTEYESLDSRVEFMDIKEKRAQHMAWRKSTE